MKYNNEEKYLQVWRTSYFWALQSFQMFTGPLFQIKLHLLNTYTVWLTKICDEMYDITRGILVNSFSPGKFEWNFRWATESDTYFSVHLTGQTTICYNLLEIWDFYWTKVWDLWLNCLNLKWNTLRWMSLDLTNDNSTVVQVMAWCHQAASHFLSQC